MALFGFHVYLVTSDGLACLVCCKAGDWLFVNLPRYIYAGFTLEAWAEMTVYQVKIGGSH